jgi:acetyl esterase/lipase
MIFKRTAASLAIALFGVAACAAAADDLAEQIQVKAFQLPRYSEYLSAETRAGIQHQQALYEHARELCDPTTKSTGPEIRACEAIMYPPILADARKVHDVRIEPRVIGGVQTDVVTPAEGVPQKNRQRVVINMHGGAFKYGARFTGQLEAMPLAAIGKYRVIAVDYRMGPEHQFPAASIDVASVYRELLKEYDAASIGLYGCSAGGRITGQTVAWMAEQRLPRPAAAAILCSAPMDFGGDSNVIVAALQGSEPLKRDFATGYFKGVDPKDPLAFPGDSDEKLAVFPPTLLMTSTRDYSLSGVVSMHSRLVRLGVPTELHIFEGLRHGEFFYPLHTPESREAARILAKFFDVHLK